MAKRTLQSQRAYRRVGNVFPPGLIKWAKERLRWAGSKEDARIWLGKAGILSFLSGSIAMMGYIAGYNPIATPLTTGIALGLFIAGFLFTSIMFYIKLFSDITDRTAKMEKVLPDFLLLMVSNLRAGVTPFAAYVKSARPRFGGLYFEIRRSAAKVSATASVVDALSEVSQHFHSHMFNRTVNLFAKGIRSGGRLSILLGASAEEVRRIQDLQAELLSSTRIYKIFLGFMVVIILPFLLSISTIFVTVFISIGASASSDTGAVLPNVPTFSGRILITPDQMMQISIGTLITTSFLVSALVGIIARGNLIFGLRYFPLFAIASVMFFFFSEQIISTMVGGFGSFE
jgi:Flp pilus assembly protein TadB